MKQILIKFPDDMTDEQAMQYVGTVVKQGKISKNNTLYCYVTEFQDRTCVSANDRSKWPTFRIWRRKVWNTLAYTANIGQTTELKELY